MELQKKLEIYEKFKTIFDKTTEQPIERIMEKSELSKIELEQFLGDNLLYNYNDDKTRLKKNNLIGFKILMLKTDNEIEEELDLKELRAVFEKEFGEIPYVRFSKNIGHLVLGAERAAKIVDMDKLVLTLLNGSKVRLSVPTLEERKDFSKNHGSHLEGILRSRYGRASKFNIDGLLSHRKGIYLGFTKFKSIHEIKSIFNKIIKSGKISEKIPNPESNFLHELLKYHKKCEEKLKDFDHFILDFHPEHKDTKCFFVVKKDGSKEDFSYIKCLKEISSLIK